MALNGHGIRVVATRPKISFRSKGGIAEPSA